MPRTQFDPRSQSTTPEASIAKDDPVVVALYDYLAAIQAGHKPDRQEFLKRHAEIAAELGECLEGLDFVHAVAPRLGQENAEAADLVSPCMDPSLTAPLGDYRIIREIGRGGMGIVYEAQQLSLGRRVALKVLPFAAAIDPKQLQRFKNESHAAAQLHHTNIVPVFGVGCERGVHYYAMQYVDGKTLGELILELRAANVAAGGQPSTQQFEASPGIDSSTLVGWSTGHSIRSAAFFQSVAKLGIQAAGALEHAHQLGIIHRDIKPANLLVDVTGNLWITDFGLAHLQSQAGLTMSGDVVGTLRYMSPEQALGHGPLVDQRSDLYSLGVTLYELLTLEIAFAGENRQEVLRRIAFDESRLPTRLNQAIPPELETIVLKAMEKNPSDRYARAQDLADDLRRYLEDRPIQAQRPTFWQRTRKLARRHPGVVRMSVGLLAVIAIGSAVSTGLILHQLHRAEEATQAALTAAASEKEAKETAQAKEAETQAVLDFVRNRIFSAARPQGQEGGLGREVTLRQAMEAALPIVDRSFTNQPVVEARLRMTMGTTFAYLDEAKIAADQYRRALALFSEHLGPGHPETLRSMSNLANSYAALDRDAEALQLREETLAIQTANLGGDHPDTLRSMINLAVSYGSLGRYMDALKLREKTLQVLRIRLGPEHPDTLVSMSNLAVIYMALGRYSDARDLNAETLRLRKAIFPPDHPETLTSMHYLATSYHRLGRYADACTLHEETLARQKMKLGVEHAETLKTMHALAEDYRALGRYADALALHQEELSLRNTKLGGVSRETLRSMACLGRVYADLGQQTQAAKIYAETLALQTANAGADHPDTLFTAFEMANCYAALGRHAEAIKLHQGTLGSRKTKLGIDHPDTLLSMWRLAESLFQLDRDQEALAMAEECARRAESKDVDPELIPGLIRLKLQHFQKIKDTAGCRTAAEQWEKVMPRDARGVYNAACFRGCTAAVILAADKSPGAKERAGVEADQALAWLKQAIAAGYTDAVRMKKDKDLIALRDRPDFQELISQLEGKGQAAGK